jgi:1,4-alpha-glucan branching enzyme
VGAVQKNGRSRVRRRRNVAAPGRRFSGYFSGLAPKARAGSRYKYKLDGGETCPDPASRFQPEGPHGSSEVVDAAAFPWTDRNWRGVALPHQVIYEMHIGTFTKARHLVRRPG